MIRQIICREWVAVRPYWGAHEPQELISLSWMVEIPRLQATRRFVMPAKAGIHLRARCKAKEKLDSGPGLGPGQALPESRKGRVDFRIFIFIPDLDRFHCSNR
jgi:hypothetical protein